MSDLSNLQGLVLGLVQGFTEFLPISSSGHLAVTQHLMGLQADAPGMLMFDVLTHVATLAAVAVVFAQTFWHYFRRLILESSPFFAGRRIAWRVAGCGVLASIPTAVIGLLLKDQIKAAFGSPRAIGVGLALTAGLLWLSGRVPRPRRGWRRFPWWGAVVVGVAQGIAIFPGISRSGWTICAAMCVGLRRRWAGEFSFFIAVPAILGAAILEGREVLSLVGGESGGAPVGPLALGAVAAFLSGVVALRLLLRSVRRGRLHWFAYYCWFAALAILLTQR